LLHSLTLLHSLMLAHSLAVDLVNRYKGSSHINTSFLEARDLYMTLVFDLSFHPAIWSHLTNTHSLFLKVLQFKDGTSLVLARVYNNASYSLIAFQTFDLSSKQETKVCARYYYSTRCLIKGTHTNSKTSPVAQRPRDI
jgi:hypothetical protein